MTWKPIETAPKDGTDVLLWEKWSDAPIVGWYHNRNGKWYANTEHYNTDGNACVIDNLSQELITHWQHLPEPPCEQPS